MSLGFKSLNLRVGMRGNNYAGKKKKVPISENLFAVLWFLATIRCR